MLCVITIRKDVSRMAERLVSDEFWARVEPVIPVVRRRHRYPGRKRVDDRACLEAIMYVLKTGCQWAMVPVSETGCSGKTAWRRMDEWDRVGVWDELHDRLLAELNAQDGIDWSTGVVDGSSQRAVFGGTSPARPRSIARRAPSRPMR
jgi:transposase